MFRTRLTTDTAVLVFELLMAGAPTGTSGLSVSLGPRTPQEPLTNPANVAGHTTNRHRDGAESSQASSRESGRGGSLLSRRSSITIRISSPSASRLSAQGAARSRLSGRELARWTREMA